MKRLIFIILVLYSVQGFGQGGVIAPRQLPSIPTSKITGFSTDVQSIITTNTEEFIKDGNTGWDNSYEFITNSVLSNISNYAMSITNVGITAASGALYLQGSVASDNLFTVQGQNEVFNIAGNGYIYADYLPLSAKANVLYYDPTGGLISYGATPSINVTSGNGMNFTDFTNTGTITLGTPSTITKSTINGFPAANTHVHEFSMSSFNLEDLGDIGTPGANLLLRRNGTNNGYSWVAASTIYPSNIAFTDDPNIFIEDQKIDRDSPFLIFENSNTSSSFGIIFRDEVNLSQTNIGYNTSDNTSYIWNFNANDIKFGTNDTEVGRFKIGGQLQLNTYTATTSHPGTAVGLLGFDSSGNIVTESLGTGGSTNATQLQDYDITTTNPTDGQILVYRTASGAYVLETKPTPGTGTAWGDITGTLSSQTDLQTVLNTKAPDLATYLVTNAHADLPNAVAVGITPGGELSGSWVSPTIGLNVIDNTNMADDAIGIAELSATGTPSITTFLNGTNAWTTLPNASTTTKGIASFSSTNFIASSGAINLATNPTITGYLTSDAIRVQSISGTSISMNAQSGLKATLTLSGNTEVAITNLVEGQEGLIEVTQPSPGGVYTFNFTVSGAAYSSIQLMGNNAAVDTGAGVHTTVVYWMTGTKLYYGFIYDN